ncbi:MAG: tetratricopeptide repeat protein [Bacteroidetes bacterium]|nr:tetratricopeptide repeat protein [Bacteroidota bacterium]
MKRLIYTILLMLMIVSLKAQYASLLDSLTNRLMQVENDTARVNILNQLASEVFFTDPDEIIDYAESALKISEEIDYQKGIAQAYNNLGIYYRVKGIYEKAIDYFFHSLEIMEDLNDKEGIARSYNLIGIIYYYLNNLELSLEYYQKALVLNEKQDDKKWIAGNSNNIGMIYERMGEYDLALEYYLKSIEMSNEIDNKNWLANTYGNLGSLYMMIGNPTSLGLFQKRLKLKTEQKDTAGIASANNLIGNYFLYNKDYQNALPYLLKSYELAQKTDQLSLLNLNSQKLSQVYAGLGNFEKAYYYHKQFKLYNDSLDLQSNTQKIMRLTLQNEFRKEQQLEELEHQNNKIRQTLLALSMVLAIALILYLYWRQRSKVKQHLLRQEKLEIENRTLQEDLEFKDKLLGDNINYLLNKNELLTNVIEKLNGIKTNLKPENQKMINGIIVELQTGIQDNTWEEFELRFNQIHSDFYNQLIARFPGLSANETRLSAFLKLNMTTKEIAAITGQSIKSIETARTRLRKKLNIRNKEQSLGEFLSKF